MLTDKGELLLEADETNFIAIRLRPPGSPVWSPTLFAGGSVSKRNGGGK
jgi:hypothetical protein